MVGDPRCAAEVIGGFAESAGVRQLQADQQAIERTERRAVCIRQLGEQGSQASSVRWRGERLVGIGASIGSYGGGLAAPDELGAAAAKVAPPPQRVLTRGSIAVGVPAFHRMDAPAIADVIAGDLDRRGHRRAFCCRQDSLVGRQRNSQLGKSSLERGDVFQLSDFRIVRAVHGSPSQKSGCGGVAFPSTPLCPSRKGSLDRLNLRAFDSQTASNSSAASLF